MEDIRIPFPLHILSGEAELSLPFICPCWPVLREYSDLFRHFFAKKRLATNLASFWTLYSCHASVTTSRTESILVKHVYIHHTVATMHHQKCKTWKYGIMYLQSGWDRCWAATPVCYMCRLDGKWLRNQTPITQRQTLRCFQMKVILPSTTETQHQQTHTSV